MNKIYFEVEDDVVIKYTPALEIGENIYKIEPVMDKDTFIKCYEMWIKPKRNKSDKESPLEAVESEVRDDRL